MTLKKTSIRAMLPGEICFLHVDEGAHVEAGDLVLAIECMKQLTDIRTEIAGTVRFRVNLGEMVEQDQIIAEIETE